MKGAKDVEKKVMKIWQVQSFLESLSLSQLVPNLP